MSSQSLLQLLHHHALHTPQAVAVSDDRETLCYGDLWNLSATYAGAIRAQLDPAKDDQIVAICVQRNCNLFALLLGIWRAGAAYLPLDPTTPGARLAYQLKDSDAALLISDQPIADDGSAPVVTPVVTPTQLTTATSTQPLPPVALHKQLAYVIYTSGSQGQPKGVAVEHGALRAHIEAMTEFYHVGPQQHLLHLQSISFDGATEAWALMLANGARIYLAATTLLDPSRMCALIEQQAINALGIAPAYLQQLCEYLELHQQQLSEVTTLTLGGEASPSAALPSWQKCFPHARICNGYGPTEAVITPLAWMWDTKELPTTAHLPIGHPVGSRRVYLLDKDMHPVADGEAGELWIGGILARGYLHRPALTAQRFRPNPFGRNGERLYRTGDLARRVDDGFEFLGRNDDQIKLRGLRIELGEIESRLKSLPEIADGCVLAVGEGDERELVGWYVSHETALSPETVSSHLAQTLPQWMVPAQLIAMSALPRLASGKLDRQTLLATRSDNNMTAADHNDQTLAVRLKQLWQQQLKRQSIDDSMSFFDLGGHSLLALRTLNRIEALFGVRLSLETFRRNPSLSALTSVLETTVAKHTPRVPYAEIAGWLDRIESQPCPHCCSSEAKEIS